MADVGEATAAWEGGQDQEAGACHHQEGPVGHLDIHQCDLDLAHPSEIDIPCLQIRVRN